MTTGRGESDRREHQRRAQSAGRSIRSGPWPWYLGTVGAILCKAVICNECGHEYDLKKPGAHLPTRKRNLAIVINAVGLVGILTVLGLLVVWIMYTMRPH